MRFGRSKQFVDVAGRPLVAWSVAAFGAMPELRDLVIATEPEHVRLIEELAREFAPRLACCVVVGGATRQESVFHALAVVPEHCDAVFVHDGARPLVAAADVRAGMAVTAPGVGALLAVPVVDTIKAVRPDRSVARTLDRAELWAAQTPQFAMLADLKAAHGRARSLELQATDDATLLEHAGLRVVVVPSGADNLKVTRAADRILAEAILRERAAVIS